MIGASRASRRPDRRRIRTALDRTGDMKVQSFGGRARCYSSPPRGGVMIQSEAGRPPLTPCARRRRRRTGCSTRAKFIQQPFAGRRGADRWSNHAQRVRRPAGRQGTGTDGLMALGFVVVGIMIYLAIRFEWKFAVAGDHRQPATWSSSWLRLLPVGVLAGGAGGGAGGAGLFGERVGGHLRPYPGDLEALPQARGPPRPSTTPSPAPSRAPSSPTAPRR